MLQSQIPGQFLAIVQPRMGGENDTAGEVPVRFGRLTGLRCAGQAQMPDADVLVLPDRYGLNLAIGHTLAHGLKMGAGHRLPIQVKETKDATHGLLLLARTRMRMIA
jgi:hypothetical protein